MLRLAVSLSVSLVAAAAAASSASSALFFVMKPNEVWPGQRVEVRTPWTQARFTYKTATKPFQPAVTLYLVQNAIASEVRSRTDSRLTKIGTIKLDKEQRGFMSFVVPKLTPDRYTIAYWCRQCAATSGGRAFVSFMVNDKSVSARYRKRMVLDVRPAKQPEVVERLRAAGLVLQPKGSAASDFFGDVPVRLYETSGDPLHVWQFAGEPAARAAAARISADGYNIRLPAGSIVHVDWIGPPHWYRRAREIVLYIGRSVPTLDLLRRVLGEQFAGR